MIWQLLLAHLLADFPLQFETVFELKKRGRAGIMLHSGIWTVLAIIFAPHLAFNLLAWGFFFLSHTIIDWAKIKGTEKIPALDNLWMFLLDQLLHIFVIYLACGFWPDSNRPISFVIPYLCFYIIAGPAGIILNFYIKKLFIGSETSAIVSKEAYYLAGERMVVFTLILLPSPFYFTIPLILMGRGLIFAERKDTALDIVLSTFLSVFCGLTLILFIR
ncbi:DUF3307 domain-containing protein [bacterium]|nr:DUF3307 domain-containing protein [bacterium]MBU1599811.1 DUF3307 domain-containing protein [bacterium]MBU2462383.1 DUF3307 domain-containing protein [bacterium]